MSPPAPEVGAAERQAAQAAGREAARHFRLPLARRAWTGPAGAWEGVGRGTALEFRDHRPYQPGDDPRHIDWQAYARTEALSMKLYREEVTPSVDLILDVSASMRLHTGKRRRSLEAFYFALSAARAAGASLRKHAVAESARAIDSDDDDPMEGAAGGHSAELALDRVSLRRGSLRVLVSDVLFPGAPESCLRALVSRGGRAVLLAPFAEAEVEPEWLGELQLVDCETGERREASVDTGALTRYRSVYRRHFESWRAAARSHGIALARLGESGPLASALLGEPLAMGAVEVAP